MKAEIKSLIDEVIIRATEVTLVQVYKDNDLRADLCLTDIQIGEVLQAIVDKMELLDYDVMEFCSEALSDDDASADVIICIEDFITVNDFYQFVDDVLSSKEKGGDSVS